MRCNLKLRPVRLCQNMAVAKRGDQAQAIQSIRYKLKDQLPTPSPSAFPRCRATSREQQAPQPLALAEVSEHAFRAIDMRAYTAQSSFVQFSARILTL